MPLICWHSWTRVLARIDLHIIIVLIICDLASTSIGLQSAEQRWDINYGWNMLSDQPYYQSVFVALHFRIHPHTRAVAETKQKFAPHRDWSELSFVLTRLSCHGTHSQIEKLVANQCVKCSACRCLNFCGRWRREAEKYPGSCMGHNHHKRTITTTHSLLGLAKFFVWSEQSRMSQQWSQQYD